MIELNLKAMCSYNKKKHVYKWTNTPTRPPAPSLTTAGRRQAQPAAPHARAERRPQVCPKVARLPYIDIELR